VSLQERDARPIAKGRLGKPVEFGYTGKPGKARQAEERRPASRKTIKWRTDSEGRISSRKRATAGIGPAWNGTEGARIWTGQAVLAHNLVKIGTLPGNRNRIEDQRSAASARRSHSPIWDFFRSK